MGKIILGNVDINSRCAPSDGEVVAVERRVAIRLKKVYGIPVPVIRRIFTVGLFLETDDRPIVGPRIILTAKDALAVRPRRFKYRVAFNVITNALMAQMYEECRVFQSHGVYLGQIEVQLPLLDFGKHRNDIAVEVYDWDGNRRSQQRFRVYG